MSIIPHNLSVKGKMSYFKSEAQLISDGGKNCNRKDPAGVGSRLHLLGSYSDLLPGNLCFVSNTTNMLFWFFHYSGTSV